MAFAFSVDAEMSRDAIAQILRYYRKRGVPNVRGKAVSRVNGHDIILYQCVVSWGVAINIIGYRDLEAHGRGHRKYSIKLLLG
jgi:hypothetical protein